MSPSAEIPFRLLQPESVEVLAEFVRTSTVVSTYNPSHDGAALPNQVRRIVTGETGTVEGLALVSMDQMPQEVVVMPDDQVVIVRGPVSWGKLQGELTAVGQCLPHGALVASPATPVAGDHPAAAIDINLPHVLEAQCGSWRDWILGLTVVLADGSIAKAGSQAVKNVAGYDLQKLFLGARGTLGIITEVILRTYPLAAIPTPEIDVGPVGIADGPIWIQRTLATDFKAAVTAAGKDLFVADHASSTLWAAVPEERELPRFPSDWVLRTGCGIKNLRFDDPVHVRFMQRAKDLFDPSHKLNPGEMGIF